MMVLREDQAKVKALLTEAITVLCKNGLSYRAEFSVEGLLGITLDNEDVFLININETIRSEFAQMIPSSAPTKVIPQHQSPMSAPPKPFRGRGGMGIPAGRGRPPTKPRKRSLEPDFKGSGSAPGTPTHPSPSPHSSLGSPPGTPGSTQQTGSFDTDQPPMKRLNDGDGGDDVMIVSDGDSNPKPEGLIKMEPNTMHPDGNDLQWNPANTNSADPSNDPNNSAMQVPSFGDELNLVGNMDPAMQNVKMENANQQSPAPGMEDEAGLICKLCDKVFTSQYSLKDHMAGHTGKYSFFCSTCNKGFSKKSNWTEHENRCKGHQFACRRCRRIFYLESRLKKHQLSCSKIKS